MKVRSILARNVCLPQCLHVHPMLPCIFNSEYELFLFSFSNIPSQPCSSRKDSIGKRLLLYTSKQKTGKYRTYHWRESKGRCWKNAALHIKAFALRNLSAFSNCCGFPFKQSAPLKNLIAFAYVKKQWTPRRFGWFRFFLFRFLSLTAVLNTAFVNSWDNFLVLGDLWMTSSKIQNVLSYEMEERVFATRLPVLCYSSQILIVQSSNALRVAMIRESYFYNRLDMH